MTKKDYELIAQSITSFINSGEGATGYAVDKDTMVRFAGWIAKDMQLSNYNFDTNKFAQAIVEHINN